MTKLYKTGFIGFLLSLLILPIFTVPTSAQEATENPVEVTIFWREECAHCHKVLDYLKDLKSNGKNIEILGVDLNTSEGAQKFNSFTGTLEIPKVTPITQIDRDIIIGDNLNKIGSSINKCEEKGEECLDYNQFLLEKEQALVSGGTPGSICDEDDIECKVEEEGVSETVKVPFFGEINIRDYSLPIMSVVLGFIDGFNPCAMWVLVMFLTLLLQTGSKKLMWQIAGLFIFAETVMYYLILNVWFTTWNFIGLDKIVTPIVAVIAIGAGIYFIYEYIMLPSGVCIISSPKQQVSTKNKIEKIIKTPLTWLSAIGIIGIALSVNIIEFACSIGIPQTFTKILEINNLNLVENQIMMAIYIFFYMLDDFIVFGIALYSFDKIGIAQKYSKACQLLGGVLMIVLGLILIFKRSWLVF